MANFLLSFLLNVLKKKKKERERINLKIHEMKKHHMETDNVVYQKKIFKSSKYTSKGKKKPKSTISSEGHSIQIFESIFKQTFPFLR